MVAPRLRRFITESAEVPEEGLNLAKISSDHSTHSANQPMRSGENLEENECHQAKYRCHTHMGCKNDCARCFANPINLQGRNLFA